MVCYTHTERETKDKEVPTASSVLSELKTLGQDFHKWTLYAQVKWLKAGFGEVTCEQNKTKPTKGWRGTTFEM